MSLAIKLFWSIPHRGGQEGGCASAVSTANTPNSSSRSSQKPSRKNSHLNNTSHCHSSKKQKQQPQKSESAMASTVCGKEECWEPWTPTDTLSAAQPQGRASLPA